MLKLVLVSTFNNFEKVHLPKLGEIEGGDLFCLLHLPLEGLDLRLIMAISMLIFLNVPNFSPFAKMGPRVDGTLRQIALFDWGTG